MQFENIVAGSLVVLLHATEPMESVYWNRTLLAAMVLEDPAKQIRRRWTVVNASIFMTLLRHNFSSHLSVPSAPGFQ